MYKRLTGKEEDETIPVGTIAQRENKNTEKLAAWIRANFFVPDARIGWIPFGVKKGLEFIRKEKINLIFSSSLIELNSTVRS